LRRSIANLLELVLFTDMRHLSALDALFLQLETPETPMHVGSLMLLRRPTGRRDAYRAIRAHLESRIHLAPIFTHRLAAMPGDITSPAWLRAGPLDLDYHIRRLRLPRPGTPAQLDAAVARLHEQPLDRDKPLWQVVVIEGLASGQVGYYSKIHHAALDGQGGIAVAQAILDTAPKAKPGPDLGLAPVVRLPPSMAKLVGSALRHTVAQYGRVLKALPDMVTGIARGGAVALTSGDLRKKGLTFGPRTPFNAAIGPERVFATARVPLAGAKAIARHYDAKLNDAVLAICAGALRRHLAGKRGMLSKPMVSAVPVSLRAPGDTTAANYVSMMLVRLATHIADPRKRMAAIVAASSQAKRLTGSMKGAIPTDLPSLGIPWLMARITPLYRDVVASRRLPVIANLIISNVPGPQVPLYLAGMRMEAYFPVSAVAHGLGLNITIVSYDGSLDFGLLAARSAMKDLRRFARHVEEAYEELLDTTAKKGV
jgi:WS/DGAT/MGAT family acyltransferase